MTMPASAAAGAAVFEQPGEDARPAELVEYEAATKTRATELLSRVRAFEIRSDEDAAALAAILNEEILAPKKAAKEFFAPMKDAANKTHKAICKGETDVLSVYEAPEKEAKKKIGDWHDEQERLRQAALAAAEAENQKVEEDVRLDLAQEAADEGDHEQAERILTGDVPVIAAFAPPPVSTKPVRVGGVTIRKKYKAELYDQRKLMQAALTTRPDLVAIFEANQGKLDRMANDLGPALNLPGVRVIEVTNVAGGAGRARR